MPDERWRLCRRNPRYQVSDQGRVKRTKNGRLLAPAQNHKQNKPGYLKVSLGGAMRNVYVHQLVAEAFLGPCPPGHNVDHINHDRYDNSVANLRYLPKPENDFRWAGKTSDGRNIWASPCLDGEAEPEGHEPFTEQERDDYVREHAAVGW